MPKLLWNLNRKSMRKIESLVSCPANKLHYRPFEPLHGVPTRQKGASFVIASAAKQSHGVVEQALEIASSLRSSQ